MRWTDNDFWLFNAKFLASTVPRQELHPKLKSGAVMSQGKKRFFKQPKVPELEEAVFFPV